MKEYILVIAFLLIFMIIGLMMRRLDRFIAEGRKKKKEWKNSHILSDREE